MHCWYLEQKPFPRSKTIAQRMNIDVRNVQRAISRLSELGLFERIEPKTEAGKYVMVPGKRGREFFTKLKSALLGVENAISSS